MAIHSPLVAPNVRREGSWSALNRDRSHLLRSPPQLALSAAWFTT